MSSSLRDLLGQPREPAPTLKPGPGYGDNAKTLNAASKAAQNAFTLLIESLIDRLLDNLFRFAETTRDSTEQRRTLSGYTMIYENKTAFFKRIEKHLAANLKLAIEDFLDNRPSQPGMTASRIGTDTVSISELSLVENGEIERLVLARRFGQRVENEHFDELKELNGRLASLAGLTEVPTTINPFRPDIIALALDDAWRETRTDPGLNMLILERLGLPIIGNLSSYFRAASGVLREAGHDVVRRGGTQIIQRGQRPPPAEVPAEKPAVTAPVTPAPSAENSAAAPGLFQRIAQMLGRQQSAPAQQPQQRGGSVPSSAMGPASGPGEFSPSGPRGASMSPGGEGGYMPEQALQRLVPLSAFQRPVSALSHLQRAQTENPVDFGQAMSIEAVGDGEAASNYMDPMSPVDVALSTPLRFVNVIRNIAGTDIGKNASSVDQTVIELVARLFDFVFEDSNLHDAIKVLLSRLQIPVLKAAMLDTQFFERDNHPARRMINALADAGLGWEPHDGREDPLYQMIERTVVRLLDEFDEDLSLFDRLADELEANMRVLDQETVAAAAPELKGAVDDAVTEEDRLAALRNARRAIDERLHEARTVAFVATFLRNAWSDYLGDLLAERASDSLTLQGALDTADDLIWSVLPKVEPEQRRTLLIKIPSLEKQLRTGIEHVAISPPDTQDFFHLLDDRWAGAIVGEPILLPEEVPLPQPEPEPDQTMGMILALVPGAILEIVKDDGARYCYKVGWISEGKSRFLLTNRLNSAPLIVTAEHLSGRLAENKLRIIDRGALVDRAMNNILAALEEVRYPEAAAS
ncbi:hypothetical protein BH10PSE17_BH10PSE17_15170 [soil metagenome]